MIRRVRKAGSANQPFLDLLLPFFMSELFVVTGPPLVFILIYYLLGIIHGLLP